MFQFPRLPPHALCVQAWVTGHDPSWVSPFGHLRINGCVHLPGAFRSLPRPSSASDAKAFTVRPYYLDLYTIRVFVLAIQLSRCEARPMRTRAPGPEALKTGYCELRSDAKPDRHLASKAGRCESRPATGFRTPGGACKAP